MHPFDEAVREAYAEGWSASLGPMTDRVRAGYVAAAELARERVSEPDVLEVTLRLGHLEGTWARVMDRREAVYRAHIAAVLDAWRDCVKALDVPEALRRYKAALDVREAATAQQDHEKAVATAVALWLLHGITADRALYNRLIAVFAAAILAAHTEGHAGALAVAADQQHGATLDMDASRNDALTALQPDNPEHLAEAQTWIERMIAAVAVKLGRIIDTDPSEQAIRAALEDPTDVDLYTDWAIGQAFADATIRAYRQGGVTSFRVITAGDERVCARCEANEAGSPYAFQDLPDVPSHPRCRCVTVSDDDVSADIFSAYLD